MYTAVAFYCSDKYGSEYRSGWEFVEFGIRLGLIERVIISDVELNIKKHEIEKIYPSIEFVIIPSIVRSNSLLRKYNDLVPQMLWHNKVATTICAKKCNLWLINGAQSWLPIRLYLKISEKFIWGPVGGSEELNGSYLNYLNVRQKLREIFRKLADFYCSLRKSSLILKYIDKGKTVKVLARTRYSYDYYKKKLGQNSVCYVPEILKITNETKFTKVVDKACVRNWIWVGQNIPRKNLGLAISIIEYITKITQDRIILNIYGADTNDVARYKANGFEIKAHGWVDNVPWDLYQGSAVYILSSIREGLPSSVIEAYQNGIFCICTDVGSLEYVFSGCKHYWNIKSFEDFKNNFYKMLEALDLYYNQSTIEVKEINLTENLYEALV